MPVFVDDALIPARIENRGRVHDDKWSHLVATTPRELHTFATRTLGLHRSHFQDHWPYPHYDLTSGKRVQALANGASPVTYGDPDALSLGRWLPPLLVTSSREGLTRDDVEAGLKPLFDPRRVLISGHARGGDQMAEECWEAWGGEVDRHRVSPEAWNRSRRAGYDRNDRMVAKTARRGGECLALVAPCTTEGCWRGPEPHGTHGASHCADQAHKACLVVHAPDIGGQRSAWSAPAVHDWQGTGDPNRKECECGVGVVRTPGPNGSGWKVEFLVPGLPATPELPPHLRMQEPAPVPTPAPRPVEGRPAAAAGDPGRQAQPERSGAADGHVTGTDYWWGVTYQSVDCERGCGNQLRRPVGETYATCLACVSRDKAAQAGPQARQEVAAIQAYNDGLGIAAAPSPSAGEPSDPQLPADREAAS